LVDTELVRLRVIARLWGVDVEANRGFEIAAELAQYMTTPAHAADTWRLLPEGERSVLEALLNAGGTMPAAAFIRRFGEIRPMGPGRLEREAPWRDPVSPAEGLWHRGLVFAAFAGVGRESYPIYFAPVELQVVLPFKVEAQAAPIQLEPVAPPALSYVGAEWLLSDVTSVLSFVHNETVELRDDSPAVWPEETRQSLSRHLRDRDPIRLGFILHLISHLGWTKLGGDGRLRLAAESAMAWLREPESESLTTLVSAWRHVMGWDELWHLTGLVPDDTATWRSDPTLARTALTRYVDGLTSGEWVRVSDFINAIRETDPDFLRPGGDYETWYVRDAASGASLTGFESWDQVEGTLLHALLTGPARWLGLVELGANAEGEPPQVFRVRAGLAFTALSEPAPPAVRPDLTVTMPAGRRFDRFQLARVADLARVDDPYVYRLTPTSLDRARQQHIGLERVLSFLDGLTDVALPDAVQSSLTRCAERGTEVWLERMVLLTVTDEAVMKQITSSPRTGRFIGRAVGSTAAVVAEQDWPSLVAGLVELGLLPELVDVEEDQSSDRM
jgi:hypothetical protein